MNAYEELAGYRFGSGRDYDKRSVETYRARVLNLVDELLNQLTRLQDEVADLRDRNPIAPADSVVPPPVVAPVVPTTWLEALAATGVASADADDERAAVASVTPPAFPAPAVASWLATLDGTHDGDDDERALGSTAGSTAELLLAAAGNAVAVQAAAVAAGPDAPPTPEPAPAAAVVTKPLTGVAPPAAAPPAMAPMPIAAATPPNAAPPATVSPVVTPTSAASAATVVTPSPAIAPTPARPTAPAPPAAPPVPPPPAAEDTPLVVTPGDEVVVAPAGAIERLPIVLDDGLPDDAPLPTPMRHWGGWMR